MIYPAYIDADKTIAQVRVLGYSAVPGSCHQLQAGGGVAPPYAPVPLGALPTAAAWCTLQGRKVSKEDSVKFPMKGMMQASGHTAALPFGQLFGQLLQLTIKHLRSSSAGGAAK